MIFLNLCSFYSYLKKKRKWENDRGEKRDIAVLIRRLLSFDFAQLLFAVSEQSALGTFSSLLPPGLAALLRSAGFFSGAVFFARMALARSALHGFQIGFKKVQKHVNLVDLVKSFQT